MHTRIFLKRMSVLCAFVVSQPYLHAQSSLENILQQLSGDAAKGYMQPLADILGANMHAGYYHSASIPTTGFSLQFDLVAVGGVVGEEMETYLAPLPPGYPEEEFRTATIFGGRGTTVEGPNGLTYRGHDGFVNATLFPALTPQLTIGSVFGTEVVVRFLMAPVEDIADPQYIGGGIRHSVSQYLPSLPIDLSASVMYGRFKAGDLVDVAGLSAGVQGSKSFSLFTLYGGLAYENSTMKLHYSYADPGGSGTSEVNIELDGKNTFRFTVGGSLSLGVFSLFLDGNFGQVTNFSGGLGFGF